MSQYRLRISARLWSDIHADLRRPHAHAHERMGMLACKIGRGGFGAVLLPTEYLSFPDSDYESSKKDPTVLLGITGISRAMTLAYNSKLTCLYVHLHSHRGVPRLSLPDRTHGRVMTSDLLKAWRNIPQGFVVLSLDAASGLLSEDSKTFQEVIIPTLIYGRKTVMH